MSTWCKGIQASMVVIVLIVIVIVLLLFTAKLVDSITNGLAPFISTPHQNLAEINKALDIKPGDTMWEIGCGDARVLAYCARISPDATFIGLENGIYPFILAKWNIRQLKNCQIRFGSLKTTKPIGASKMYLYLLPEALDIIYKDIPKGCWVVSTEYCFSQKIANKSISLKQQSRFAHKLSLYRF